MDITRNTRRSPKGLSAIPPVIPPKKTSKVKVSLNPNVKHPPSPKDFTQVVVNGVAIQPSIKNNFLDEERNIRPVSPAEFRPNSPMEELSISDIQTIPMKKNSPLVEIVKPIPLKQKNDRALMEKERLARISAEIELKQKEIERLREEERTKNREEEERTKGEEEEKEREERIKQRKEEENEREEEEINREREERKRERIKQEKETERIKQEHEAERIKQEYEAEREVEREAEREAEKEAERLAHEVENEEVEKEAEDGKEAEVDENVEERMKDLKEELEEQKKSLDQEKRALKKEREEWQRKTNMRRLNEHAYPMITKKEENHASLEAIGEIPNFDVLTTDEKTRMKYGLLARYDLLERNYKIQIKRPPEGCSLKELHIGIESALRELNRQKHTMTTAGQYRFYLIAFMLCLEYVFVRYLGLNMGGYTQAQCNAMDQYEMMLIELGEKNSAPGPSEWPVEARLLFVSLGQAVLFLMMKTVSNLIGVENSVNLQKFLNQQLSANAANPTVMVNGNPQTQPFNPMNPSTWNLYDFSNMMASLGSNFINAGAPNTQTNTPAQNATPDATQRTSRRPPNSE